MLIVRKKSGYTAGTKIGEYSFTATPNANYAWSDTGLTSARTFTWKIVCAEIMPQDRVTANKGDRVYGYSVCNYVNLEGDFSRIIRGDSSDEKTYTYKATPMPGYKWSDGTTTTKTLTWKIINLTER